MLWKIIKRIIYFLLMLLIIFVIRFDHRYGVNYKIIGGDYIFATYTDGNVYIGDSDFIDSLNNINEYDVLIIDNRDDSDSDYKVLSSYKITDNIIQNEILYILLEYDRIHPSSWRRSIKSMKAEWIVHNLLYYFDYQVDRTRDVDFNNADERIYNKQKVKDTIKKIARKIINHLEDFIE